MAGRRFVVSGDPIVARNTIYSVLQGQGFTISPTSDWSARAERGSQGASIAFGAFAGKAGRHVILNITCAGDGQGNLAVTLEQGTSGWSGGLIGKGQADSLYSDVYTVVESAFRGAGVLLASNTF